jgi:Cohesin domain.
MTLSAERAGDTVVVTVSAARENVAGYQANVTYDLETLRFQNATGVDFGDPVTNANADIGWVFLTQSRTDGTTDPVFARLIFRVVGEAGSETGLGFVESDSLLNSADAENVETTYETTCVGTLERGDDTDANSTPDDGTPTDETPSGSDTTDTGSNDDGGVSSTLVFGVGAGLGVAALLGVGIVLGMRLGSE